VGVPIFRQEDNYRFFKNTTQASDQQDLSPQSKHHIVSWLSTMHYLVDLAEG
jgi:hypothetical protein